MREHDGAQQSILTAIDYADAKDLYRLDNAYKMIDAIYDHGRHDAPYFQISPIQ